MSRTAQTISGFSLIEMLVLIVVVGILASVAMQSMTATVEDIRQTRTEREMEMLAQAIVGDPGLKQNNQRSDFGYVGDIGAFPANLQALYQNPGGYATWDGPYLPPGYEQDSTGFKTDEWGALYSYSGGTGISSTGSGSTVTNKIADATDDYLLNAISGSILDAANEPPGTDYLDSVDVVITYPNGSGSTANKTYAPSSAGLFILDSIPVGTHLLRLIYKPEVDTVSRYLTVLPRHKGTVSYRFASAYFGGGGGGPVSSDTLILSTAGSATLGGVTADDQDLVQYITGTNTGTMFFTGSSVYTSNEDTKAFHLMANGHLLLSTDGAAAIGGLSFDSDDIVDYDPVAGTATLFLDGGTLFSASENIDAIHLLANGHLLLSTDGAATAAGLSVEQKDIFDYDPVGNSAVIVIDGDSTFSGEANINGVHLLSNGHFAISTNADETIGSLSFGNEDIVELDTSTGVATMYFDGDVPFGTSNENIDALHIGAGSGTAPAVPGSEILRPDGVGSISNLTASSGSNYQCVDETSSDGDATYVKRGSSSYATDVYSLGNPSASSGTIDSVVVHCMVRRTKNQGDVQPTLYINSTEYNGSAQSLTSSYVDYPQKWATNPSTSSAWTWTEINNLQAGVRAKGQNSIFPARCTQVWVEVFYVN